MANPVVHRLVSHDEDHLIKKHWSCFVEYGPCTFNDMKPSAIKINLDLPEVPFDDQILPGISLVLPYNLKMKKQPDLFNFMTDLADKIEKELLVKHPKEKAIPVINKLRCLIKEMRCRSDGKSVGIFVSPFAEKIYYFTPSSLGEHTLPVLVKNDNPFLGYNRNQ